MADPREITPDALEILIARDLRKAGLAVSPPRRRALDPIPDDEGGGYRLALAVDLSTPPATLLMVCHSTPEPVDNGAVERLAASVERERDRQPAAQGASGAARDRGGLAAEGGPAEEPATSDTTRLVGALVAAAFTPDAVTAASEAGLALLRVADGRASFDATGYGPRGHYPMWLPEYVLELAGRDAAGLPAFAMITGEDGPRLLAAVGLAG